MKTEEPEFGISDSEFERISALVYRESGMRLNEHKKALVVSRLGRRLRALGLVSFEEYYERYLIRDKDGERLEMLDLISTNKTGFFREPGHFDFLKNRILPDLVRSKQIFVWSAGCSSGEEPYSIAMTLLDNAENPGKWDFNILASDLSSRVLAAAEAGIYDRSQIIEEIDSSRLNSHFLEGKGANRGKMKIKNNLRNIILFKRINLMDASYPVRFPLDLIFCRNVMIYFDRSTQEQLVGKLFRFLKPGGYLFIGHSETLQWIHHAYEYVAPTIYRKPG